VCRIGSAVNTRLIARGVLAGAVGGLAAFAGARIGAEPIVGHLITVAGCAHAGAICGG